MTNSMETEWKHGPMALGMKGRMHMGKNMDMESFTEQMGVYLMESFMKTI